MRNQNPKNVIMSLAECVPSMRYDGCEDFSLWQQRSREILRRLAGTDLCGLVAPRRLVILAGEKDGIFPIEGVKSAYNLGKSLYK